MTTQWVNTQPDAGALHALLLSLPPRIDVANIDELWIFPTRRIAIGESTVVVLSLFDADDPDRRRVTTARFTVARDRKGVANVQDKLDEYGTAPLDAVTRVVDGVVRRLGEDIEQPPRHESIHGTIDSWHALLLDLGAPKASLESAEVETAEPETAEPETAEPETAEPETAGRQSGPVNP